MFFFHETVATHANFAFHKTYAPLATYSFDSQCCSASKRTHAPTCWIAYRKRDEDVEGEGDEDGGDEAEEEEEDEEVLDEMLLYKALLLQTRYMNMI